MKNGDQEVVRDQELPSELVTTPEFASLESDQASNASNQDQILEQSKLLVRAAASLFSKEKKLEAVKTKLQRLKSKSATFDDGVHYSDASLQEDEPLLKEEEPSHSYRLRDQESSISRSPVEEFVAPEDSVRLDVEEVILPRLTEDWTLSSLTEKDMDVIAREGEHIPIPQEQTSMQVVIDSQPKDGASIDIFGALPQQVSGSWVDPHVVDGTKSGKDPDTARHQYSKSESMSDKESKIQRLKEFMSNTSSRKIGFGSATTQMTYTERSDLSNTGHTDRSARSLENGSDRGQPGRGYLNDVPSGRRRKLHAWGLVKTVTSITPSFLLSGKRVKKVRFNLDERSKKTINDKKQRSDVIMEALYRLGTYWNNFNLPTLIVCTWEVFVFPIRLALGPDNEYVEIRSIFHASWINHMTTNTILIVANLLIDLIFILDITFKILGQAVLDEDDYQEKEREIRKLRARRLTKGDKKQEVEDMGPERVTLHYGPRTREFLRKRLPMYLFGCVFSYFPYAFHFTYWVEIAFNIPRLYRIILLFQFIRQKELDVYFEVRTVAFFKFCLTVFGVAHWIGCMFYWIPRVQGFPGGHCSDTWLYQFQENSGVPFNLEKSTMAQKYMIIIYRGFNSITNLAYEPMVPRRVEEMLACTFSIFLQLFIEAYVLGTLFHYLVKKDTAQEEYAKLMTLLHEYSEARHLPKQLQDRLVSYFEFQKSKNIQDDGVVLRTLPNSLKMKFTNNKYSRVFEQNTFLFRSCNALFLNQITVKLKEFYLMPGETMLRQGEMPRELCFVKMGIVEASKDGIVSRRIRFDSEGSTSLGEVAFFMGIAQREAMSAVQTGDVTLVIFSKLDYEDLMANYPEQHDIILTNLLAQYDLDKNGNEMGHKNAANEEDENFAELQQAIQGAIQKRNSDALSTITYAASNGDVDTVRNLLARGVPINQGDYDNRTTLHLASSEGNLRVVEVLLQEGADPNCRDRWSGTPLSDAISNKRTQVVELLRKYEAKLVFEQPASMLCGAATVDDIAMMEAFLQNGVDANCSDYDQRTALHLAASEGMLRVSEFLIRSGTAVNCVDRWTNTPLVDAVRGGHEMLIKLLRNSYGVLPKGFGGDTLCQACADGDIHMIELLLEAGVDVNTADYDQRSALHVAASEGQLISVYFLLCKNADINAQDRWRSTALQDSLEGNYLDCARLLSCFGGKIGDSASPSSMEVLSGPDCPPIEDVWAKLGKLNKMVSNKSRKGYMVSTNVEEVVVFNHRVMLGMVGVLSKIKQASLLVTEQLTMMHHSWIPVYDFCTLLVGSPSNRYTQECEAPVPESPNTSQGLSLDVTTLCAPRRQEKPDCIPELQFPGSTIPSQPPGPVIGIFDNFEAILEEDARVEKERSAVHDSGVEGDASPIRDGASDTKGRDVHRLLLKFGYVEKTLKELEDKLIQVAAYPTRDAVKLLLTDMEVRGENEAVAKMYAQCRKCKEDVSEDLIGAISVPGLLSSIAFLDALEQAASDPDSWMLKHPKPASRQFVLEVVEAITLVRRLFEVFDDNNDGAVEMEELEALQSQMGTLMTDIMRSGLERYGAKQGGQLTYRQFSACILIYLDLEKGESDGSESSDSEGTWSNIMDDQNEVPDDEPLLQYEGGKSKTNTGDNHDKMQCRIEDAYSKVLVRRDTLDKAPERTKRSKLQKMFGKLWLPVATFFSKFSQACVALLCLKKPLPDSTMDLSKCLNIEEFTVVVHQTQPEEEQVLSEIEIKRLFENFDTDHDGLVSFLDFRTAVTEHLQHHNGIRSLLDTDVQTAASGRFVVDIEAKWLVWWDKFVMVYLAMYYFFEVPFNISFRAAEHLGTWYFLWQHGMDVFLWMDIILSFFRPYINESSVLEDSLGAIRRHYLGSYFPLDLAAAFPIDLIVYSDGASHSYMAWLRAFRLLRIYRYFLWRKQAAPAKTAAKFSSGLKRLVPIMFSASHILGCIWWYIGTYNVDENSDLKKHWIGHYQAFGTANVMADANVLQQYILCFFWATASLSTNGQIGDSQPKTFTEMIFGCVIMLHSLTVYVYLLSELSDLVMNQDQELVVTRRQVQTVQSFIKTNDIPSDLSQEIVQHFDIITSQSSGGDSIGESIDIFSMLSHSLQVEVARNISRTLVETCYVFEGCDGNFIDSICVLLREVTVPPENYLFRINEVSKELYIIARGSVELMDDDETAGEVVSDTLEQGMLVGELGFFFGMRQTMHARTPSGNPSTLFSLDKNDYQQLAKLYPEAEEHITRNILEFWDTTGKSARSSRSARGNQSAKSSARGSARTGRSQTADGEGGDDSMSAIREMLKVAREKKHNERIGRIIDAAAVNDLEEVRRIFMGGDISVDESDYDDRTPLHLAASNGHISMVKHLVIVHGADINVIDRYNGTPISDAVRGRHSECAAFLRQQGAALQLEDPAGEICQASADGDLHYLKMLVENGIDPNVADYDSRTSLHLAASNNCMDVLRYLCRIPNISVNSVDRTGGTPLQDAVRHKHKEAQIVLREAGGNFGTLDVAGVLCAAGAENNLEMIQIMCQSGVDMNSTDYDFRTALHLAASNGSLEVASFLLQQKGIDVNPVDRQKGTPLEDAIRHGQDVIHSLLKTAGGVCSDHPSLRKKLDENAHKRENQMKINLNNRAHRVVEATHEYGLIKKLEILHSSLHVHSIDLQQNCVTYYDSLNILVEASSASKEWCPSLEVAEKKFHSSQKQILFRTKEIMKILSDGTCKECFESKLVRISEPEMVARSIRLIALLPKIESSILRASDQAEASSYYFDTFQEELIRRENEKRQAKVKKKIMKLGLQRKQTSMSEAAMDAILSEGPIVP